MDLTDLKRKVRQAPLSHLKGSFASPTSITRKGTGYPKIEERLS